MLLQHRNRAVESRDATSPRFHWAHAASGVRAGSSRCACTRVLPRQWRQLRLAEWEPRLEPCVRGYAQRGRPLWETGVVPVTPWPGRRPLRPRTVLHCGGPPGRAAVCTRESSGPRPTKETHPTCAIVQPAVSLRPPCRGHYTFLGTRPYGRGGHGKGSAWPGFSLDSASHRGGAWLSIPDATLGYLPRKRSSLFGASG